MRARLTYRLWSLLVLVLLVTVLVTVGALADLLLAAILVSVALTLLWTISAIRLRRPARMTLGPGGGPPPPPDGDGVREPRRPRPLSPAGAAALPIPEEPPGRLSGNTLSSNALPTPGNALSMPG